MKTFRVCLALSAMALLLLVFSSSRPQAFHSGGVAECSGCHSMHSPAEGGFSLLKGRDPSSTCLLCHEHAGDTGPSSYHISTAEADMAGFTLPPKQRTPGGDFAWVKKDFTFTGENGQETEDGAGHGHNIIADEKGYVVDPVNSTAPGGGSFPANQLACSSCHDPHGSYRRLANGTIAPTGLPIKGSGSYPAAANEPSATEAVGVYRLLAGNGYSPGTNTGVTYAGAPAAKVPNGYNQSETTAATQVRVAYGVATAGGHVKWGTWCGTCHPNMHSDGHYVHPVDQGMSSTVTNNYNAYVKTGDITGSQSTAYSSLVPFVKNSGDYAAVLAPLATNNGGAGLAGPAQGDQVTCLSCHRAHASGMEYGLRFDIEYEFMTKGSQYIGSDNPLVTGSRAGVQARGRTNADWQAAYYDRPATNFATYQRVLCNKCHVKD